MKKIIFALLLTLVSCRAHAQGGFSQPAVNLNGTNTMTGALRVAQLPSDPPGTGARIYYNTTSSKFRCFEGGSWGDCGGTGGITGAGVAGRCTYWDGISSITSDDGCLYNALTNTVTIGNGTDGSIVVDSGASTNMTMNESGFSKSSASTETVLFSNPGAGICTVQVEGDLTLISTSARTISISRHSSGAGASLTVMSQGAVPGGTDLSAGDIVIEPGVSTGTGTADVVFRLSQPAASTGTSDNAKVDVIRFEAVGNGDYLIRPNTDGTTSVDFTYTGHFGGFGPGSESTNVMRIVDSDKPTLFYKREVDGPILSTRQCNGGIALDECTSVTTNTMLTATANSFDVIERNNFPWFVYTSGTTVTLVQCTNGSCTTTASAITIATGGNNKYAVALAKAPNNDHIGVVWSENTGGSNYDIKYRRCEDPSTNCTTLSTTNSLSSFTSADSYSNIRLVIEDNAGVDYPLSLFRDTVSDNDHYTAMACTTATCSSFTATSVYVAFGDGFSSDDFYMARDSDGQAAFVAAHGINGSGSVARTFFYKCTTLTCSSFSTTVLTADSSPLNTVGINRRSSGFLDLWYQSAQSNIAYLRRCSNAGCSSYAEYNVYNASYEPGNRGPGSRIAGVSEQSDGDVRVFGHLSPDTFTTLDISSGNPGTIGVSLGNGTYRFTDLTLVGDALMRNLTASGIVRGTTAVTAGTATSLNKLDVAGAAAVGSSYGGLIEAPANGLMVQGKFLLGTSTASSSLATVAGTISVNSGGSADAVISETGIDVASGSTSSFSIGNSGAGLCDLTVDGKVTMNTFRMTNAPTTDYVLTSDGSGNGSWQVPYGTPVIATDSFSTNQNDYAIGGSNTFARLTPLAASLEISGITAGVSGRDLTICNLSTVETLIFKNQSASSTAANRMILGGAADFNLTPELCFVLIYDNTTSRWRRKT